MAVRLAVRSLPPAATQESVEQMLEQAGFSKKTERVIVQRVLQGKAGTSTKLAVPSTAFITVPNEQVGSRLCKKLASQKELPLKCELALTQKVPAALTAKNADTQQAGTWTSDPLYAKFEETLKPKTKNPSEAAVKETTTTIESSVAEKPPVKELAPLVAHMKKELLAKRHKQQKARSEQRKRKAGEKGANDGSAIGAATTASKPQKQNQQQKQKKPPATSAKSGSDSRKRPSQKDSAGTGGTARKAPPT